MLMYCCFAIFVVMSCNLVSLSAVVISQKDVVILDNEECSIRPTLVEVVGGGASSGPYFPVIISLHRCGGSCDEKDKLSMRQCEVTSSHKVKVDVVNKVSNQSETLEFVNHTSCACKCMYTSSGCTSTQVWDESMCKCLCSVTEATAHCPSNHTWNPNECRCECDLECTQTTKMLNKTSCNCDCRPKFYRRCNRKELLLSEQDCKCYEPEISRTARDACKTLPTKWAAIIILVSFSAFFIVLVDCVLYCKNTGCVYTLSHVCLKKEGRQQAGSALRQRSTENEDDTIDIVQCKSIKPVTS